MTNTYVINYRIPGTSVSYDLGEISVESGKWAGTIGPFEISFNGTNWEVCETSYTNMTEFIEALRILLPYNNTAMNEVKRIVKNATDETTSLEHAKEMFKESIKHAREMGVPEDRILKTKSEIDAYFG